MHNILPAKPHTSGKASATLAKIVRTCGVAALALGEGRSVEVAEGLNKFVGMVGEEWDMKVRVEALQAVVHVIQQVKNVSIPHMPAFMPVVVTCIEQCLAKGGEAISSTLLESALSVAKAATQQLPSFMSPYLETLLKLLTHPSLTSSPTNPAARLAQETLRAAGEGVQARLLVTPTVKVLSGLGKSDIQSEGVVQLLAML